MADWGASTLLPLPVSISAGIQYDDRLAMPPTHVELPDERRLSVVESARMPVFPKNRCRWAFPGWFGKTIGSSLATLARSHTTRKAPVSPSGAGCSEVARIRSSPVPGEVGG